LAQGVIHWSDWSEGLTLKGNCWRGVDLEIPREDVEDGAIVDIIDAHEVTHLILVLDPPDTLPCHQHTSETALFSMRPFLPNFFAGMEE
jgi:hypothetical protein